MHFSYLSLLLLTLTSSTPTLGHQTVGVTGRREYNIRGEISGTYLNSNHETSRTSLRARASGDPITIATQHVEKLAPGTSFRLVSDHYTDEDTGITHVYFIQTFNGIDIENTQINVNVKRDGSILSAGTNFVTGEIKAPKPIRRHQELDPAEALKGVFEALKFPGKADDAVAYSVDSIAAGATGAYTISGVEGVLSEPTAHLRYYNTEDGLKLVWRLETDFGDNWLITYADSQEKGKVYSVADYVAEASYLVYPLEITNPLEGSRVLLTDPAKISFSPNGWHKAGSTTFTTTQGNNGIAQENWDAGTDYLNNKRADGGPSLNFSFPYDFKSTDPKSYIDTATTQLFYTANMYHDFLESLGFTEQAGNFEEVNTGPGGLGGDAVQLNAQDGSGYNNANFATPADGIRPRMRMYLWNAGSPMRDGDFDQGVVLHEYTHGLSNRLTGGPARANCLTTLEAGGMGEGWSDTFATTIRIKKSDSRARNYLMGEWVNNGVGIRRYPYSTSMTANPTTYQTINGADWQEVHAIGSVWANILYEVVWNLIDKHGYDADIFPKFRPGTRIPTSGRTLALKLILEGMKLQPCNPTFLTARDAIIDAELALSKGENYCELWKGFAKRGLGVSAKQGSGSNVRIEDFDLPAKCQ